MALQTPDCDFRVGNTPGGLAAGDFNNDGIPISRHHFDDNTVSVLTIPAPVETRSVPTP